MFQLDLLDFNKGDHDLFRSVALLDLQVDIIGGNARDALGQELAARGFDEQHHVPLGVAADDAKEARKLGFEKTPVESELAALKGGAGRQRGNGWCSLSVR